MNNIKTALNKLLVDEDPLLSLYGTQVNPNAPTALQMNPNANLEGKWVKVPLKIGKIQVYPDKFIAEGGYARVYVGFIVNQQTQIAIKRISVPDDKIVKESVLNEIKFMVKP